MNLTRPLALLALGVLLTAPLRAYDGDPTDSWHRRIAYQGHLELDGRPVPAPVTIQAELYLTATGGSLEWSQTYSSVAVHGGAFTLVLGDDPGNPIPDRLFSSRAPLYLQLTVNGVLLQGRQRLMAAPFSSATAAIPPGMIMPFAGELAAVPAGWLPCDGRSVARAEYPALFAAIGTAHGSADGNSFNLPDYRGRFLRGVNGGSGLDSDAGTRAAANPGGNSGDAVGSVQDDATRLPTTAYTMSNPGNHNHDNGIYKRLMALGSDSGNCGRSFFSGDNSCAEPDLAVSNNIVARGGHTHSINGGGDSETRPKNAGVHYLIKY